MAIDEKLAREKMSGLLKDPTQKDLPLENQKYVLFSDMHLGDGGAADDFRSNEKGMMAALDYYCANGYSAILLGDIEEFWQFDFLKIKKRYNHTIYHKFRAFGDGRVHRIAGNHDSEWGAPQDPIKNNPPRCEGAADAIRLTDAQGKPRILLTHGHQGDEESDKASWSSKFFVRLYKIVEPVIKIDTHSSATKSQVTKGYERIFYRWAKENRIILICGHSHRAIFASKSYFERLDEEIARLQLEIQDMEDRALRGALLKELEKVFRDKLDEENKNRDIIPVEDGREGLPCYFNAGCALYGDGLTAIEIDTAPEIDLIRLVKWPKIPANAPEILQSDSLSKFLAKVQGI
jgi:UDP-2,3-diacylglucosamine pyrophosphatase LpxH